ncbi:MAG: hypothetical protein RLZ97_677, partial [Verrucomicrobiota bacterium]
MDIRCDAESDTQKMPLNLVEIGLKQADGSQIWKWDVPKLFLLHHDLPSIQGHFQGFKSLILGGQNGSIPVRKLYAYGRGRRLNEMGLSHSQRKKECCDPLHI